MNRPDQLRMLILALLFLLIIWDVLMLFINKQDHLSENHRQVLLTGILLWISSLFLKQNRDDDWAGQL